MRVPQTVEHAADADQARQARSLDRYAARHFLWAESNLDRVKGCGAVGVMPGGAVACKASGSVATGTRRAGFGGLMVCGSTWACPVCSAKIATHRAVELGSAVQRWHDLGGDVTLVTLTQRHDKGQSLAELWGANGYAWAAVTSGKAWKTDQDRYGVQGFVRVVEVTHGKHGWHVHVHALILTMRRDQLGYPAALGYGPEHTAPALDLPPVMFQRWRSALLRKGMAAPLAAHGGLDARTVARGDAMTLGDYFTKSTYKTGQSDATGAGFEVAAGQLKTARHGNRTPFAILADVVAVGLVDDLALWHEWEEASHGRRQLTWSKGLRDLLAVEPALTDEEAAELDAGGEVVLMVPAAGWRLVCARRVDGLLKHALEQDDTGLAAVQLLDGLGIPWDLPPV